MSQSANIPFNKPYVAPNAMKYVEEALNSDHHQGGGFFNKKAADLVKEINGGGEVFLTSSCTQALEMATILLDLKPGDEVIMPSYTFTSAATALVNFGVIPVFVDIEPVHLNIDPNRVREAITSRTKAISVVNYAGHACDFEALDSIADEFGLIKIEDNAHGLGNTSNGRKLGTWGDLTALSFHATKNIQCGEGGALIVNNSKYSERAQILQEKGTNRKEFINGGVEKYEWKDKGGSFLLSEINSALLFSQLEDFAKIQTSRRVVSDSYINYLKKDNLKPWFRILNSENMDDTAFHMFAIHLRDNSRSELINHLSKCGVSSSFHYQPLHKSTAGLMYAKHFGNFENTLYASERILRLPIWPGLTLNNIEKISLALLDFKTTNLSKGRNNYA